MSPDERPIENFRDSDRVPTDMNSDEFQSLPSMLLEVEDIEDKLRGFFWPENLE